MPTDPDEAVGILAALTTAPVPRGARACVVTSSGGAGAWAADTLAAAGLELPELTPELQAAIRALIPSYGSARNPVDITAQIVHTGALLRVIELLERSEEIDVIVAVSSMARETRVPIDTAALKRIIENGAKPILFYSYTLPSVVARKTMAEAGVVVFTGLAALGRSVRELVRRAGVRPATRVDVPEPSGPLRQMLRRASGTLTEHQSKAIIAAYGVDVLPGVLVRGMADLEAAARSVGYPLALKIQSRDIPHKTEAGGVRLNVADQTALETAYEAVIGAAAARAPAAAIDGVLIEPMAKPGIEVIVGVVRDEVFGPVLMVGGGGATAELFQDVCYRLAPVDEREAREMLAELRVKALLDGFRGAPRADVDALAILIARVSAFAVACRDVVREIELNPVIVHAGRGGCSIADALIALEPQPGA